MRSQRISSNTEVLGQRLLGGVSVDVDGNEADSRFTAVPQHRRAAQALKVPTSPGGSRMHFGFFKLIVSIVVFCVLLATTSFSQFAFIAISHTIGNINNGEPVIGLVTAMSLPFIANALTLFVVVPLAWIRESLDLLPQKQHAYTLTIFVSFIEAICEVAAILIFVIKVVPGMDMVQSLAVTNGIVIIPSLLLLRSFSKWKRRWQAVSALLSILLQFAGLTFGCLLFSVAPWAVVVALALGSVGFWSNFAWVKLAPGIVESLEISRYSIAGWKCFFRLILLFFGTWIAANAEFNATPHLFFRSIYHLVTNVPLPLFWVSIGGSIIAFFTAWLAVGMRLQLHSFAPALSLATPAAVVISAVWNHQIFDLLKMGDYGFIGGIVNDSSSVLPSTIGVAALLWVAHLVVSAKQVFRHNHMVMPAESEIWHRPLLPVVFGPQALILNRRRDDSAVKLRVEKIHCERAHTYVCLTMWHETDEEMEQVLQSLVKLDEGRLTRFDSDRYSFEFHIIFDDAFRDDDRKPTPTGNRYVTQLRDTLQTVLEARAAALRAAAAEAEAQQQQQMEGSDGAGAGAASRSRFHPSAASSSQRRRQQQQQQQEEGEWSAWEVVPTVYGGRVVMELPFNTLLFVHLKDVSKVKQRKRWSQVLYLGILEDRMAKFDRLLRTASEPRTFYLLALDGDVAFEPEAVQTLIHYAEQDSRTGAVSGRIYPRGDGMVAWYQRFEYALGHWLQKTAEHVLGSVLCCPGCFSLFRLDAVMECKDAYSIVATTPRSVLELDQGEDRCLSTMLVKRGYWLQYCADAEAGTFCPVSFDEFFNQRRRWITSTMINLHSLFDNWRQTCRLNPSVSSLYILYTAILFASTTISPATVILVVTGGLAAGFDIEAFGALFIALALPFFFLIFCVVFRKNRKLQVQMAEYLHFLFMLLIGGVVVGLAVEVAQQVEGADSLFIIGVSALYIVTGLFHPSEFHVLFFGLVYVLWIPTAYLLLIIFAFANIDDESWGTREKAQAEVAGKALAAEQKKTDGFADSIVSGIKGGALSNIWCMCRGGMCACGCGETPEIKFGGGELRDQNTVVTNPQPTQQMPGSDATIVVSPSVAASVAAAPATLAVSPVQEEKGTIAAADDDDDVDGENGEETPLLLQQKPSFSLDEAIAEEQQVKPTTERKTSGNSTRKGSGGTGAGAGAGAAVGGGSLSNSMNGGGQLDPRSLSNHSRLGISGMEPPPMHMSMGGGGNNNNINNTNNNNTNTRRRNTQQQRQEDVYSPSARTMEILRPRDLPPAVKIQLAEGQDAFRRGVGQGLILVNLLWIIVIITLNQQNKLRVADNNAAGLVFLVGFGLVLFIQFLAMIWHRIGTLLHSIAEARIINAPRHRIDGARQNLREMMDDAAWLVPRESHKQMSVVTFSQNV